MEQFSEKLLSGDKGRQQQEMVGELASILISVVSILNNIFMITIILISVVSTLAIIIIILITISLISVVNTLSFIMSTLYRSSSFSI